MRSSPLLFLSTVATALLCSCAMIQTSTAQDSTRISLSNWTFQFGDEQPASVTVPHTWNADDACAGPKSGKHSARSVESSSYKRGLARYTTTFNLPEAGSVPPRTYVRGEGASIVSEIIVNGHKAGHHEGAFTAFCYDITPYVKAGANTIEVTTDNTWRDHIAPLSGDFSMFGGLYRPITIICDTPSAPNASYIPRDFLATPGVWLDATDTTATLRVLVIEDSADPITTVTPIFPTPTFKPTLTGTFQKTPFRDSALGKVLSAAIPNNPDVQRLLDNPNAFICSQTFSTQGLKRWSTSEPNCYTVRAALTTKQGDIISDPFTWGFRTYQVTHDRGFILNGVAQTLRGVNRHQDRQGKGWAVSADDEAQDIAMIQEIGATGLRTAHYPQTQHIYDLCDRAGIVVWSEVSCVERVRDTDAFRANIKTQAAEMILQHYNHPSICIWGFFNEIYHQTSAADRKHDMIKVLKELNALMKQLDTRPTIGNTNQGGNKQLNTISDLLGANVYPGWYGGGPDGMKGHLESYLNQYKQPFGLGEYGHGADIGDHEIPAKQPRATSPWHPEEWQAYAHERNYYYIKQYPQLFGTFIWAMFDFATAERIEGAKAGMNDKGLITYDRAIKKDAFYFYKANWNPDPMIHLCSKRATPRKGAKTIVRGYCNLPEAELWVNGKLIGKQKPSDLKVLEWKDVSLKPGENHIELRAQTSAGQKPLSDRASIRRD